MKEPFRVGRWLVHHVAGSRLGYANVRVSGDEARIEDVFTFGSRNALGPRVMRSVLRQFREENPGVSVLTGERVSGARFGGALSGVDGNMAGDGTDIRVPLPPMRRRAQAVETAAGARPAVDRHVPVAEQLETVVRATDALDQKRLDLAEADFGRMKAAPDPEPKPDGTKSPKLIDIGADELVPEDFAIPVDIGPDGKSAKTMTVRQILDEFDADEALIQATRSCAL